MSKVIPFIYEDRDELYANTYVLIDDDNNCVVIDPAKAYDGLVNYIKKNNLTLKGVLLTHGHADHIRGVDTLVNAFNAPVYIGFDDLDMLKDTFTNCSEFLGENVNSPNLTSSKTSYKSTLTNLKGLDNFLAYSFINSKFLGLKLTAVG